MGPSPVDLPDPLENDSTRPLSGADDLLSRLAGDEIDRLMGEDPPPKLVLRAPEKPAPPQEQTEPEPKPVDEAGKSEPVVEYPPIQEVADNIQMQLDELLAEVDLTPVPFMTAVAEAERLAPEKTRRSDDSGDDSPIYVKPLEWLSAIPPRLRNVIGYVAVAMFVLAIATLVYVWIATRV